jgi:hypothetical protein
MKGYGMGLRVWGANRRVDCRYLGSDAITRSQMRGYIRKVGLGMGKGLLSPCPGQNTAAVAAMCCSGYGVPFHGCHLLRLKIMRSSKWIVPTGERLGMG